MWIGFSSTPPLCPKIWSTHNVPGTALLGVGGDDYPSPQGSKELRQLLLSLTCSKNSTAYVVCSAYMKNSIWHDPFVCGRQCSVGVEA